MGAFAFAALGALLAAAPEQALRERFAVRAWNDDNGLPQSSVLAIQQARDGMLWLGTQVGAFEFDGRSFTPLQSGPASERFVTAIMKDGDGDLWIGTGTGEVLRQRGDRAPFQSVRTGLAAVTTLVQDASGTVWAGTAEGLVADASGPPAGVVAELLNQRIHAVLRARDGAVWVAGARFTVRRDGTGWVWVAGGLEITALYEDRDGRVWYGTSTGAVGHLQGANVPLFEAGATVRAFLEDDAGTLWVGTAKGLYSLRDGKLEAFHDLPALAALPVLSLLLDREHNLWVGTDGGGLFRIRRTALSVLEPLPGEHRVSVMSISGEGKDRVWLGTNGAGLVAVRDGRIERRYTSAGGLAEDAVTSVVADGRGGAWVGLMSRGVQRLTGGRIETPEPLRSLAQTNVLALYLDRKGRLWIGTLSKGLYVYAPDGARLLHIGKDEGLRDNCVFAFEEGADGRLWVGTRKGLSVVRDGAVWTAPGAGDVGTTIMALHEDRDGVLWIGSYKEGLHWLKPDGTRGRIRRRDGLLDDIVYTVLEDEESGRLWMSGIYGLFSAPKRELLAFAPGGAVEIARLGKADGMVSAEANGGSQPAGWRAPDGKLWFPTVAGAMVVDPAVQAKLPPPVRPRVRLDEVLADGKSVTLAGATVPPGHGELEVRYRGISLASPEDVRYRYRLEPLESEWREGPEATARYTNLPPGPYRFRVEAFSRGAWSAEETTGEITLRPQFVQTWWFRLLVVAGVGALAGAVHWARTRRLLARSAVLAERNRLAREIHDGLTQSLTGILIQLEAAVQRWSKSPEASHDHVERARDWARLSLVEARGAVAALRQSVGTTEALAAALQRAGEALTTGTTVRFDVTSTGNEALAPEVGEALLRIGQEALTNALRHGKPGAVAIRVEAAAGQVSLLVRDDGSGFDPETVRAWGSGLRGMRERADAAAALLEVRSAPGGPTEILARAALAGGEPVAKRSRSGGPARSSSP